MLFWGIAAVLVGLVCAATLLPMWLARPPAVAAGVDDDPPAAVNARLFYDRLADLDAERDAGRIDAARHAELKTELERNLLQELDRPSQAAAGVVRGGGPGRVGAAVLLALALPLAAAGYYYLYGYRGAAADWIDVQARMRPAVERVRAGAALPEEVRGDPSGFIYTLASTVLRDGMDRPDDLYLLGSHLLQFNAAPQAVDFLRRASELAPQRNDVALAYAQALLGSNQGRLDSASAAVLHQVLAREPGHRGALMMLGFGAFNDGNYPVALSAWQPLLKGLDPDSEPARLLRNSIAEAERQQRAAAQVSAGAGAGAAVQGAAAPGKAGPRIAVTVDLAPALRERLPPDATLFIYAKAAGGPPMPLAAVRRPVGRFPVEVVLDDSQAMLPSMRLSDFADVVVGARISQAGDPVARAGDLAAADLPLTLAGEPHAVSLTVDRVVQ